jgi:hypothetical protein
MTQVRVLPSPSGPLVRFKCTCGRCEDRKPEEVPHQAKDGDSFSLEGFQEIL